MDKDHVINGGDKNSWNLMHFKTIHGNDVYCNTKSS